MKYLTLVAVALWAGAFGDQPSPVFSLPSGPYQIGFRSLALYDYTRTYRTRTNAAGERETHERARPVQTSIWYPAKASSRKPLRYGDYFAASALQDGPLTPRDSAKWVAWARQHYFEHDVIRPELNTILRTPVRAVPNAVAATGRFPVVVYNAGGGQPSWDNSVLFEFLASHGYVVVASPSTWDWERDRPAGDDYESVEAAARDIEFQIGYARSLPFVDPDRLALAGYSWGGLASPIVALRNPSVSAVVGFDGSVTWADSLLAKATHQGAHHLRAAFIEFHSSGERYLRDVAVAGEQPDTAEVRAYAKLAETFGFFDGIRYADRYNVTMIKFNHGNFASHFTILAPDRKPGEPTLAEDQEGYGAMARYTLTFLNAYVRGDSLARRWLGRTPAENGIPDGVMRIVAHAASPLPAPTIEALAAHARQVGIERTVAVVDSAHRVDSSYTIPEGIANLWAERLDSLGRADWSAAVRRLISTLYPATAKSP